MVTISRNPLLVYYCECRLSADTRDQPPTAARVPRGHRREPPMVLIGPVVIVAALMVIAVPRLPERPLDPSGRHRWLSTQQQLAYRSTVLALCRRLR